MSSQNLARPADLYFFFPVFMNVAVANCATDKPAKITGLKLPCRTQHFLLIGARFFIPAGLIVMDISF